ncbi:hypothetical protein F511_44200 [Dorcoceras hygrometricum]|uniref:Uncharacterized protein n=1 Tax=Dorcoceras hygrometricum TaxID=472368 RepID=A0A2Z7AES9_9LAMI|nr:hypothetical protein F511_44200 [Dorcoceras hygrometricum]
MRAIVRTACGARHAPVAHAPRARCGEGCAPVAHTPARTGRRALHPLAGTRARTSRTVLCDTCRPPARAVHAGGRPLVHALRAACVRAVVHRPCGVSEAEMRRPFFEF